MKKGETSSKVLLPTTSFRELITMRNLDYKEAQVFAEIVHQKM